MSHPNALDTLVVVTIVGLGILMLVGWQTKNRGETMAKPTDICATCGTPRSAHADGKWENPDKLCKEFVRVERTAILACQQCQNRRSPDPARCPCCGEKWERWLAGSMVCRTEGCPLRNMSFVKADYERQMKELGDRT